ncbi:MAG TPA: hypothetical protein VD837_01205 [Terriglobales bacterium]|nr:hypothetical protein [Terriglobales bacterium]
MGVDNNGAYVVTFQLSEGSDSATNSLEILRYKFVAVYICAAIDVYTVLRIEIPDQVAAPFVRVVNRGWHLVSAQKLYCPGWELGSFPRRLVLYHVRNSPCPNCTDENQ